jgi:RNA polymerase II subunit A small phosphatase-like protein
MKMGQFYEVVVFTASLSEYAIPLVKELDKLGIVVHMLYREHCTSMNGIYVKDLSRLGRDLKDVIIVDNSPNSFLLQPENAFHIRNFFEDKSDVELYELGPFLEFLSNVDDVRPIESWRKKYSNLSKSLSDSRNHKRKVNTRQESTVPLNHESITPELRKESHNEDDDSSEDEELELENRVTEEKNSKRAEKKDVTSNKIKVPPIETSKTNTHETQSGNQDKMIFTWPNPICLLPKNQTIL